MESINELVSMGADLNAVVIVLTIMISSVIIKFLKKKNSKTQWRLFIPSIVGIVVYSLWAFTNNQLGLESLWSGFVNAVFATGMFSKVRSWLKDKGIKI